MDQLTPDQARQAGDRRGPALGYLCRLSTRMSQIGVDVGDPKLYRLDREAEDALHIRTVELHYQSCGHELAQPADGG